MKKNVLPKLLFLVILVFSVWGEGMGQCAMCKATVATNQKGKEEWARGINKAILYLMVFPYFIVGGLVVLYIATKKKKPGEF